MKTNREERKAQAMKNNDAKILRCLLLLVPIMMMLGAILLLLFSAMLVGAILDIESVEALTAWETYAIWVPTMIICLALIIVDTRRMMKRKAESKKKETGIKGCVSDEKRTD